MCSPVALMAVGAIGSLAGGVLGAAGDMESGRQAAAGYNDRANFLDRQAGMQGQAGAYEVARTRASNDRQIADVRNDVLSSGFALEGSFDQVTQDMAREASLDEQAILYGTKVDQGNLRFEAKLNRRNADAAKKGASLSAIGKIIGGVTGAASSFGNRTMITNPYAVT